jgi:hypothetical protein
MRPNSVEIIQGIQGTLMTYVQPVIQDNHVQTELMLVNLLLGIVANDWDGAAQGLVDDNTALRTLVGDAAAVLKSKPLDGAGELSSELEQLAAETETSVRISDLSAANDRLRDGVSRLGALLQGNATQEHVELRARVIERLQQELQALPHNLMGARADG